MSLFSLSSDGGVADMDFAGDFARVVALEELLPGAGVSSERLPPLMVISSSVSIFVVPPCWTWVPLSSLVMVMLPSPM